MISSNGNINWFNEEINQATKEIFRIHSQLRAALVSNRTVAKIKFDFPEISLAGKSKDQSKRII